MGGKNNSNPVLSHLQKKGLKDPLQRWKGGGGGKKVNQRVQKRSLNKFPLRPFSKPGFYFGLVARRRLPVKVRESLFKISWIRNRNLIFLRRAKNHLTCQEPILLSKKRRKRQNFEFYSIIEELEKLLRNWSLPFVLKWCSCGVFSVTKFTIKFWHNFTLIKQQTQFPSFKRKIAHL